MTLRQAFLLFALITAFFNQGCRPDSRIEEARLRKLDSLEQVAQQDSLLEVNLNNSLGEPLRLIGERRLDSIGMDCFRFIAVFSWGTSPVGPVLSIRGCREDSTYSFTVHTFPPGKDPNDMSQRRRRKEEKTVAREQFLRISNALDSIGFERIPVYINVDYAVMDASAYYIERYKNGKYHVIVRASAVDSFVYKLLAEASEIADMDSEIVQDFRRLHEESRTSIR